MQKIKFYIILLLVGCYRGTVMIRYHTIRYDVVDLCALKS